MLRHTLTLLCAVCALASASFARAQTPSQEIVMFVGEIKSIPANKAYRVAVGNGSLISTKFIEPDQMLLIAEGVGDSSLVLWSPKGEVRNYTLRIGPKDSGFAYKAAREMLADIPSVKIVPMGPNIALTGAASPSQMARINALVGRYPQLMPLVKELDVEMKKMIYMKVQIMEVKKSLSESLGVSWPGSFGGPTVGFAGNIGSTNPAGAAAANLTLPLNVSGMRTYLGITSSIQTTINIAKANGDLTILAEPELSARSGGTASFLAGGQIPLQSAGALGATNITYKDYGIKLTIKPAADDSGNVITGIKAEMSQLDQSTAVSNNPGFLTRTAETEINVRSGQTMVISGLINRGMQNDVSRVPGLGDLPIIGSLFRSNNFRNERTDLLIAVTPVVVDATSSMNQERIEKGLEMKERFERNLSKKDILD
ncbi:MAG: pilus assembly protein N-terminal domain-containing protein [Proteobacteria bacterium]|nr:pilus assembly protein N-terminal domain-containing protein [Pseudomonadota bacterium]HQR04060.1 pilus assembly protein N-terminal domain-containing protein [Rhodocyclaceae bacterium]